MAPTSFVVSGIISKAPVVPLVAGGVITALVSALTARRIMAPLNRLLQAANRIGASREVVPAADERLGEFTPSRRFSRTCSGACSAWWTTGRRCWPPSHTVCAPL